MSSGREAPLYPDANGGGAVFCLGCSPGGRSLWGKPGLGGFEPARGEAPIEAACLFVPLKSYKINTLFVKQLAVGKLL
jgi:hypothetical protein